MKHVSFRYRNFQKFVQLPNDLVFNVQRYSNRAMGGPYQADIRVTGSDLSLWQLIDLLRCPVYITGDKGDYVWWGYVAGVDLTARNPFSSKQARVRMGINLDQMFNNVAVAWEDIAIGETGGQRYTTDYAADTLSQAEYGIKDGLFSGESATVSAMAEQTRDIFLEQKKYPVPTIDFNVQGNSEAILYCRGWWETLNWRQCSITAELALSYWHYTGTNSNFGTVARESIAQGIQISGGDINAAQISVYLRKQGAPTDNLTVAIYDNPDDLTPTTLLDTSNTIDGSTLDATNYAWVTFTFSPEYTLSDGTKYFIVLERSGAADNTNYYQTEVDNTAGYGAGTYVYYNGSNWVDDSTYDMQWRIYDNVLVETSVQILNIATQFGQFFSQVESEVASGITSESYRDGDGSALYEIEQLMAHGTDNNRRMLAKVDYSRRCTIYEEPANSSTNYYKLHIDGSLLDDEGAPVRDELATAGIYARMVDVIPPSVDTGIIGNAAVRFLEITEYDVVNNRLIYTARDELDPFTVGRTLDG